MLPRLLRHCYCYADSRFSNPVVSGLAAYAMKRCSMKRKSIISVTQNSPDFERTKTNAASSKSTQGKREGRLRIKATVQAARILEGID
jgi:hypothetical protein